MNARTVTYRLAPILAAAALVLPAAAQNGRPAPQAPRSSAQPERPQPRPAAENQPRGDLVPAGPAVQDEARIPVAEAPEELVTLTFNETPIVDDIITFIVRMTGKVVIPIKSQQLRTQKITLVHEKPIPRSEALDMVLSALRLNDIGVIAKDDRILVGQIQEIMSISDIPVLGPEVDVRERRDLGNFVVKVFRLKKAAAELVAETLEEHVPDYASLTADENSNQLVVIGDIALCQHLQHMIDELDNRYITVKTQTYRLQYADAFEIADNIYELFEESESTGRGSAATRRPGSRGASARGASTRRPSTPAAGASASSALGDPGPIAELRLTVNQQQNTVTVQADPAVIAEIDKLIYEEWDLPRPEGTSKTYTLNYTDPIKVRDMLEELLETGGGGGGARAGARGAAGGGGGSRSGVQDSLSGIYQIEAYPDSGTLVVLCKTEESFGFLDSIVHSVDQPSSVGLPVIIELKHAEAVSLADELNVLLSEAGSNITLERPDQGLSASGIGSAEGDNSGGGAAGGGRETEEGGEIRFPWMAGGRQRDDQAPESSLIGKIRIVPIIRQNALALVAPPQYQESVRELIHLLDRPGRQVMISAVIAEVELTDDLALGLRVSGTDIPLSNIDNSLAANTQGSFGRESTIFNVFDTNVLDVNVSANLVLQALDQKTNVRVLQEPRVFTADNQEAVFFDGQDIPFVTDSFTNNTGGLTQGFEYRQVGVVLNVRPRITAEKDVDMEVYLELSSIVPGQTLFGGFIVDRRSTTSQVVVKNGQTIVVSGILRDQESEIKRKVPFIGDLPLIGGLFQSTENNKTTTELIAFVTPVVVDTPSENDTNFNVEYRDSLEKLRRPISETNNINSDERRDEIRRRIMDPNRMRTPMSMPEGDDLDTEMFSGTELLDPDDVTITPAGNDGR